MVSSKAAGAEDQVEVEFGERLLTGKERKLLVFDLRLGREFLTKLGKKVSLGRV